jgi:hypothetical protein
MYQEYPKCLMRGDECKVVFDADQELSARELGFIFHTDSTEPVEVTTEPKRRGRPPKAKE